MKNIIKEIKQFEKEYRKYVFDPDYEQAAVFGENIDDRRFDFIHMIERASRSIFVAGQALYYLTKEDGRSSKFMDQIFSFLKKDRENTVRILVCDPEVCHAVKTWQEVSAKEHKKYLESSIVVFKKWLTEAEKDPVIKERLEIKKTDFIPVSVTFVDYDCNNQRGICVLIPNMFERTHERPYYVISEKVHESTFKKYRSDYIFVWDCSRSL